MGMPQRRRVFASLNPRKKKCSVAPVSALVFAGKAKTGSTLAMPPTVLEYPQLCVRSHSEKVVQELSVTNQ